MMGTKTTSRVLVVDDEPQIVWMLQFSLEAEGYQTLSAADGSKALDEVREHHPNVVLLDIMMPVMDGWAFLEELQ
ncbi:MAG TPA: response regulator, partial [Actinomycetota bacterium]|nr:response regulator [Actinomycetota bacterium]